MHSNNNLEIFFDAYSVQNDTPYTEVSTVV